MTCDSVSPQEAVIMKSAGLSSAQAVIEDAALHAHSPTGGNLPFSRAFGHIICYTSHCQDQMPSKKQLKGISFLWGREERVGP